MPIASRGATMAVDGDQRVDIARLRSHRLARVMEMRGRSSLGAPLSFDPNNLRYVSSTAIGTWERDRGRTYVRVADIVPSAPAEPVVVEHGA